MYTLFTDSDTDMTPELCAKYGYKLISMPYTLDGKTIYPYVDFQEFDYHAFYDRLRKGNPLPSTSALPPQEYIDYFEPEFKEGRDILYVHFSAAMSGTFNSMRLALEELKQKYPDRKVYEVDTKGITLGSLNICLEIGEMYKAGKSIEEILKWAEVEVDKFAIYFYLGFYQTEPASTRFWFGSPIVNKAEVKAGGKTFTVVANNNSKENKYIQSVTLNGKPYDLPFLDYKDIMSGGKLVLEMGPEPALWY